MKHLIFALSVLLGLTGAAWPLNPLVTRTAQPSGPVPAECEEGLAPTPMPRVNVAEIPAPEVEVVPASFPAPPSSTLRSTLEEAHAALVRNDRPAFDAALDNAREIVRDYPPGAERTNAEEAVRAYDDAAFVWSAQFQSPFFDQNSEAYACVSRYPGYAEAVRRGVFTDDRERRFYPAAESRDFLTRVASERLNRLGIRTTPPPTRVARAERPRSGAVVSPPSPAHRRSTGRRAPSTVTTTRTTPHHPQSRKSATPAISAPASPDPPASTRAVTESAPAAPPKASAPTPAAPASPAAEGQPVADTPAPAVATTPEPAPVPVPDTIAPAPATTTTAAPAAAPAERRSVIIPALLILIGLGVLIVLFRVSK